jgi:hypothetical protein
MNTEEAIDLLRTRGDPLERVIVDSWATISQVLNPYAGVWAHHVYPRRNPHNPSVVTDAWMPFTGSHYTAIVRVYHALKKWERIQFICHEFAAGSKSGELLLEAHEVFASFWEHIGTAIDNLARCFEDAPCINKENGSKYVQIHYKKVDEAYDRRTQFIHSRLVPMGVDGGMLFFNSELFKQKNTNWREKFVRPTIATDYYEDVWTSFMKDMSDLWSHLLEWLRNVDNGPFKYVPLPDDLKKVKKPGFFREPSGFLPPSNIRCDWEEIEVQDIPPIDLPDIPPSGVR